MKKTFIFFVISCLRGELWERAEQSSAFRAQQAAPLHRWVWLATVDERSLDRARLSDRAEEALQIILRRCSPGAVDILGGVDCGQHLGPLRAERGGNLVEVLGAPARTAVQAILNGADAETTIGNGVGRTHEP